MPSPSGGWKELGQACLLDINCIKTQGLSFGCKHFGSSGQGRLLSTQGWSIWDHQWTVWTVELVIVCCLKKERDVSSLNDLLVDIVCWWRHGWFCKSIMVHSISQVLGLLFLCFCFLFFFNCQQYWSLFSPKCWCHFNGSWTLPHANKIKCYEAQTAVEGLQRPKKKMDVLQIDRTFDSSAACKFHLFQASDILWIPDHHWTQAAVEKVTVVLAQFRLFIPKPNPFVSSSAKKNPLSS